MKKQLAKLVLFGLVMMVGLAFVTPMALAADEEHAEAADGGGSGLAGLGIGIGAGLAIGLAGLGTGLAQSGVGAGGMGAIVEKPELFAQVLILFAIPETIVILGFVIAFLLLGNIG